MSTVSYLHRKAIHKRGVILRRNAYTHLQGVALPFLTEFTYELVSVRGLGLKQARLSEIVYAAKLKGYALCKPAVAYLLARDGPQFPLVRLAMVPKYNDGVGSILFVANAASAAIIDAESFAPLHKFSPFAVFAFRT